MAITAFTLITGGILLPGLTLPVSQHESESGQLAPKTTRTYSEQFAPIH